jgi:hypothetical protein
VPIKKRDDVRRCTRLQYGAQEYGRYGTVLRGNFILFECGGCDLQVCLLI